MSRQMAMNVFAITEFRGGFAESSVEVRVLNDFENQAWFQSLWQK